MRRRVSLLAAVPLLIGLLGPASASAISGPASFDFFAGSGPVCPLDPSACPDVARAPNGDTVELTGSGTISVHPKSASGAGTFTDKDAAGNVLVNGTWEATKLLSFHSYGSGAAQGLPPELWGGQALIRVHLTAGGNEIDAILTVDCALGKVPPGAAEGVTLNVPGIIHFNKSVSGFTVFVML